MTRDEAAELLKRATMTITRIANPAGVIIASIALEPVEGYLLCDGKTYLREDYPILYDALPSAYQTTPDTFRVPSLAETYLVGSDDFAEAGDEVGSNSKTLSEANMPSHSHGYDAVVVNTVPLPVGGGAPLPVSQVTTLPSTTGASGAGQPFDAKPKSIRVMFWVSHGQG